MTRNIDLLKNKLTSKRLAIAIIGPTATGKSGLAVMLAESLDGEIISLDSMQVYIGMDIGTGKIRADEMRGIRHHLIDLIPPNKRFSAGEFQRMAEDAVERIWKLGKTPIIVGGTGLYLRAFLKGLFPTPVRSDVLRKRIKEWESREGLESLYDMLKRADPGIQEIIKPADRQRIHRALEIFLETGKTQSSMRKTAGFAGDRYKIIKIGLDFTARETLYKAIGDRVDVMFEAGWIEEVKRLLEKYPVSLNPFKAIGYREIAEHLQGNLSLEETIAAVKQKTRNYAKRQVTWYKQEDAVRWFNAGKDKELVCNEVLKYISAYINDEGEFSDGGRAD